MKPHAGTIDRLITKAKKLWGVQDWNITYELTIVPHQAEINLDNWIEHRARISLDKSLVKSSSIKDVFRLIVHEVGHIVVYPIYRGAADWVFNRTNSEEYKIFEESQNTRENETIGHIMAKMLKV